MSVQSNILPFHPDIKDLEITEGKVETKEEKLQRLQKLIDNNKYEVSAGELAQSILDSATDSKKNSKK